MERIVYILLIVLCCSCGARKKTVHTEYDYKRDIERLETKIEQLVEVAEKKLIDLSQISKVEVKYSAPDSCQKQYVISETRTEIKVNTTLEEATQVNVVKKDSLTIKTEEVAQEVITTEDVRESTIKEYSRLVWSVIILLASIVLFYLAFKFRKQIVSLLKKFIS